MSWELSGGANGRWPSSPLPFRWPGWRWRSCSPPSRSTATILIEEQEIPSDIVRSAITSYADQRIETIKQQIMTRSTLWRIIEQYGLYSSLRENSPTEEVLERFTKDIRVDVINAKVIDKRTQSPSQATIAFTLTYEGESPPLRRKWPMN